MAMYNDRLPNVILDVKFGKVTSTSIAKKNPAAIFTNSSESTDRIIEGFLIPATIPSAYEFFMKQLRSATMSLFHQLIRNSGSNNNQSSCNLRESDCLVYIYHIRDACAFFLYRKAMYNRIILNEELNVKWTRVGLIKSVRKNPAARFTKNSDSIDCITRALKDHILQDTLPSTYEIFMKPKPNLNSLKIL